MDFDIDGVPVSFPYEPYNVQREFMAKVIESCKTERYALLESPTGTGKTLSLLCGSLSYVRMFHSDRNSIIYSSRTHTQLQNVVKELKRTQFRPSLIHLASRKHLCINNTVKHLPEGQLIRKCRQLNKTRACPFNKSELIDKEGMVVMGMCLDIEEFSAKCEEKKICPYYTSQILASKADMVLTPYSYLVDPNIRDKMTQDLFANNILIFDEAHNFPDACSSTRTFQVTLESLKQAREYLDKNMYSFISTQSGNEASVSTAEISEVREQLMRLSITFARECATDAQIRSIVSAKTTGGASNSNLYVEKSIDYLLDMFKAAGITAPTAGSASGTIQQLLMEDKGMTIPEHISAILDVIVQFYRTIFGAGEIGLDSVRNFYSFCITADPALCLLCNSAAPAFREMTLTHPMTIILTSGTLAPLDSFAQDLGDPFPVRLEGQHVTSEDNIFLGVVDSGPNNVPFNFTYSNRHNKSMTRDLLGCFEDIFQIAPSGVLSFFSSFGVMNDFASAVAGIKQTKKKVIKETKNAAEQSKALEDFKKNARRGAALLAVMRGKLSEGIDFADEYARCVNIVGVPYPSLTDYRVELKRKWLDLNGKPGDGSRWYSENAVRAVNQAIGRAIRHRNDYSAILLFDQRYKGLKPMLSKWAQRSYRAYDSWEVLRHDLAHFYKRIKSGGVSIRPEKPLQKSISQSVAIEPKKSTLAKKETSPPSTQKASPLMPIEREPLRLKVKDTKTHIHSQAPLNAIESFFGGAPIKTSKSLSNMKPQVSAKPVKASPKQTIDAIALLGAKLKEVSQNAKCACCGSEHPIRRLISMPCKHNYCRDCLDMIKETGTGCIVCSK